MYQGGDNNSNYTDVSVLTGAVACVWSEAWSVLSASAAVPFSVLD